MPAFGWYEWTGEKGEKPSRIPKRDLAPIYMAALANPVAHMNAMTLLGFTTVTAEA